MQKTSMLQLLKEYEPIYVFLNGVDVFSIGRVLFLPLFLRDSSFKTGFGFEGY